MNAPPACLALVSVAALVGCSQSVTPSVVVFDAGPMDALPPADVAPVIDVAAVGDTPTAVDASAPADAPSADAPPVDAPTIDAVTTPDVFHADVPDSRTPRTHPLLTADDVVALLDLHQFAGTTQHVVLTLTHRSGDDTCPGRPVRADGRFTADRPGPCSARRGAFLVDFGGAWRQSGSDICASADGPATYDLAASAVTVRGTDETQPVDLAFDGSVRLAGTSRRSGFECGEYSWEGTTRWTSAPTTWLSGPTRVLQGRTVRGIGASRSGNGVDGYRYGGWIGTTTPDGGAELGAELETVEPIRYDATSTCRQPVAGRLVLHGAVDVDIRYVAGPSCAMPTWTRAGVAMGSIDLVQWRYYYFPTCAAGI